MCVECRLHLMRDAETQVRVRSCILTEYTHTDYRNFVSEDESNLKKKIGMKLFCVIIFHYRISSTIFYVLFKKIIVK